MNQAQFAALCGVSGPMVSKYVRQQQIVFTGSGDVDALASLKLLDGTLDDDKRLAALAALAVDAQGISAPSAANDGPHTPPPLPARTAKSDQDEYKADLLRLELAKAAGEVMTVAEVESIAYDAIGKMREAFDAALTETANTLIADLNLPIDKAAGMKRRLKRMVSTGLGAFSTEMLQASGAAAATDDDPDAIAPNISGAPA